MTSYRAINEEDIAKKLYRKRSVWPRIPEVDLVGTEGKFGYLVFDFGDDDPVRINVYIHNAKELLDSAVEAVKDFEEIINHWFRESYD